ncbi:hypothetical protein KC19_9G123000 [Ceratodon purpureus]|uniref:Uncharacterized protein n=1 Tax=Ceratodon purpureus TaxID=3225 RepID=A0A8T0GUT2_CERPU|nr:hypothetical protein KC19_9G123000 [Ceratodon purpureus]
MLELPLPQPAYAHTTAQVHLCICASVLLCLGLSSHMLARCGCSIDTDGYCNRYGFRVRVRSMTKP